jgi:hypothetical protein
LGIVAYEDDAIIDDEKNPFCCWYGLTVPLGWIA